LRFKTYANYFSRARDLRAEFDRRFHDPLEPRADRFIWDYWHVPNEYTLLRTQAHTFFRPKLYEAFHRHLVEWGRTHLGCHDISPPWLSCYVEGCRQEWHSDVPHGPLAFVYSLTKWNSRQFRGGETFLQREKDVPARFNQMLVFNPAIPHGVRQVRGTHDPRHGRLVIHGWFVNPRPFWYGPLKAEEVGEAVDQGLAQTGNLDLGRGFISYRLKVRPDGQVAQLKTLVSTLDGARDLRVLERQLKGLRFPKKRASTLLTLPLMID